MSYKPNKPPAALDDFASGAEEKIEKTEETAVSPPATAQDNILPSLQRRSQEGKVQLAVRITPSIQKRIRRLVVDLSDVHMRKITVQDWLESIIIRQLDSDEKMVSEQDMPK